VLTTPSGGSEYLAYRDPSASPPSLVVVVGKTTLSYQLRAIDDLQAMLKANGDWVPLGSADEQKTAADDSIEGWGRSIDNPVGGWYGLKRDSAADLECTFRRCSNISNSPKSNTNLATTGCERSKARFIRDVSAFLGPK
jgi:hypothetical protein